MKYHSIVEQSEEGLTLICKKAEEFERHSILSAIQDKKGNLENDHPTGCLDPYGHRHHPRRHQLHERLKSSETKAGDVHYSPAYNMISRKARFSLLTKF